MASLRRIKVLDFSRLTKAIDYAYKQGIPHRTVIDRCKSKYYQAVKMKGIWYIPLDPEEGYML